MRRILHLFGLVCSLVLGAFAQSNTFTYQGKLTDGTSPANGPYLMQFSLWNAEAGGTQIGQTLSFEGGLGFPAVQVSNGVFTVHLDFGVPTGGPNDNIPRFDGNPRWIEIAVRGTTGAINYTTLTPRQPVTSEPYSIRSTSASSADAAITANNALNLDGVAASQYVNTSDPRMSDARTPLAGSGNYIQNSTGQQSTSNFNLSGTGKAGIFDAATQYNLGGNRILGSVGTENFFAGVGTGASITTGQANSFFGNNAGTKITTGVSNNFFGDEAGANSTTTFGNNFFGTFSGNKNTTGEFNNFFGQQTGQNNLTGTDNSFFGSLSGSANVSGNSNSFFGFQSGLSPTTGSNDTAIGASSDVGSAISNATAIGANAQATTNNSLVLGAINGVNECAPAFGCNDTSVGIGITAPSFKLHVVDPSNKGLRVQTNIAGGTVASFGGSGAFQIDKPGINGGRFTVLENGNVGIGINIPDSPLHVNGNVRITNGSVIIANPNTVIITSPNGACWGITVSNTGALTTFPVSPCP